MSRPVRILSIDGGGIRGIIPAVILKQIEQCAKKPIHQLFDLIAGTSTGGIISLGLCVPNSENPQAAKYTAADLIDLYETYGHEIFSRNLGHRILSFNSLLRPKYPHQNLEKILSKYFLETKLSESLTEVLIPAYEIERRIAWFFKSSKARENTERDPTFVEVARATSAAPTYFQPSIWKPPQENDYFSFVDGGVYANNPAMCAFVEAKNKMPNSEEVVLVSIGTGYRTKRISYNKAKNWGLVNWAQPILNVVFDGVEDTVDYQLKSLFEANQKGKYFRLQTRLDEDQDAMDKTSFENIRSLKLLAERLVNEQGDKINEICKLLG